MKLTMTLAEWRERNRQNSGHSRWIDNMLKDAGFDLSLGYSLTHAENGDYIYTEKAKPKAGKPKKKG